MESGGEAGGVVVFGLPGGAVTEAEGGRVAVGRRESDNGNVICGFRGRSRYELVDAEKMTTRTHVGSYGVHTRKPEKIVVLRALMNPITESLGPHGSLDLAAAATLLELDCCGGGEGSA
ncbi:protein kinase superfamily protein [Striga asiatica]|uniref:Protein kinase superfamily protein n=1 Tax=Striga asiatica TaxID=4170 RepID=A0A5A7PXG2_STRAF|nr:protein kinase superfamily protein [Striga asiatica]